MNTHEIILLLQRTRHLVELLYKYVEGNFRKPLLSIITYNKNFGWKQKGQAKLLSTLSRINKDICSHICYSKPVINEMGEKFH